MTLKSEEVWLIFVENDLVGFSFRQGGVYSFDRFESELACITSQIKVEFLGFEVSVLNNPNTYESFIQAL